MAVFSICMLTLSRQLAARREPPLERASVEPNVPPNADHTADPLLTHQFIHSGRRYVHEGGDVANSDKTSLVLRLGCWYYGHQ